MNTCYYLLEANIYLLVFYAVYRLALYNETFYAFNRLYLLSTSVAAFIMPAIGLSGLNPHTEYVSVSAALSPDAPNWTIQHTMLVIYLFVATCLLSRFFTGLYRIWRLVKKGSINMRNGVKTISVSDSTYSFSFLNYLFIHPSAQRADTIICHEQVHIRQLHSLDILFFEILHIFNWFNPAIGFIKKDIKAIHEFIADEETAKYETDIADYALFLIHNSYGVLANGLANSMFNHSLLKTRIMKLNQKKSPGITRIKYVLALLLLPLMLFVTAITFAKSYSVIDLMPAGATLPQDTAKRKQRTPPPPPVPPKKIKAGRDVPPPPPPMPPKAQAATEKTGGQTINSKLIELEIELPAIQSPKANELKEVPAELLPIKKAGSTNYPGHKNEPALIEREVILKERPATGSNNKQKLIEREIISGDPVPAETIDKPVKSTSE